MKASDLINQLLKLIKHEGDMEVDIEIPRVYAGVIERVYLSFESPRNEFVITIQGEPIADCVANIPK